MAANQRESSGNENNGNISEIINISVSMTMAASTNGNSGM